MRLIDADALIEAMKKTESEYENAMICPSWWNAFNVISEQPTAYDIDKVVEELKIIKEDALAEYNMGEYNLDNNIGNSIAENYRKDMNEGRCFAYDDAIEIVKQGGVSDVSDDVCEWIKYDYRTICPKNHDANNPYWRIPDNMDKLKYCPYCGKKILCKRR